MDKLSEQGPQPAQLPRSKGTSENVQHVHKDETSSLTSSSAFEPSPAKPIPTGPVHHGKLLEGEVRLVDFGADDSHPALTNVQLDAAPDYIAISYCWGSENCLHAFKIDHQILILTSSLYLIFQELWEQGYRGKIWADAICIRQDDDEEKRIQIPLMQDIHRNAVEVLAWLGPGRAGHESPIQLINKFTDHTLSAELQPKSSKPFRDAIERLGLHVQDSEALPDILDLLCSPWFDRLWTFQEAVISRKLFVGFGRTVLAWQTLSLASRALVDFWSELNRQDIDSNALVRISRIDSCRQEYHSKEIILRTVLENTRGKKVTYIQDRVHAIYGFMGASMRQIVPFDIDVSPRLLFTRLAKAIITFEPSLDLLANAETPEKLHGLPSWVPDLTSSAPPWILAGYCGYNAGLAHTIEPALHVSLQDTDDHLKIAGFHFATVTATQRTMSTIHETDRRQLAQSAQSAGAFLDMIDRCRALVRCLTSPPVSESEIWTLLGRVLVCDRPLWPLEPCTKSKKPGPGHLQRVVNEMKQIAQGLPHDFGKSYQYSTTLSAFNIQRSCFMTAGGRVGLGPADLQTGDHILILRGGETPSAARRQAATSTYRLLGECFVDGIMEGQAYHAYQKSGKKEEILTFE